MEGEMRYIDDECVRVIEKSHNLYEDFEKKQKRWLEMAKNKTGEEFEKTMPLHEAAVEACKKWQKYFSENKGKILMGDDS